MKYLNDEFYAHLTDITGEGKTEIHYKQFDAAVNEERSNATVLFDGHDGNRYIIVRNDMNEEINGQADFVLIASSVPADGNKNDLCDIVSFCNFDTYQEAMIEMMHISATDNGFK